MATDVRIAAPKMSRSNNTRRGCIGWDDYWDTLKISTRFPPYPYLANLALGFHKIEIGGWFL